MVDEGLPESGTRVVSMVELATRGDEWLTTYRRALKGLTLEERAEAHFEMGHLLDALDAPRAAARSYGQSSALRPTPGSWREEASVRATLGQLRRARYCLVQSAKLGELGDLWSEAAHEVLDLEFKKHGDTPYALVGDALAAHRASFALKASREFTGSDRKLWEAAAFGVAGELQRVLRTWESIARGSDQVTMRLAHWFYLPASVLRTPEFWLAHERVGDRFGDGGVYWFGDSVSDDEIVDARSLAEARRKTWKQKIEAVEKPQ